MAADIVGGAVQTFHILPDALVIMSQRKCEVSIVGLCRLAAWPFIDHEITAARFNGVLEAVHGLDERQ